MNNIGWTVTEQIGTSNALFGFFMLLDFVGRSVLAFFGFIGGRGTSHRIIIALACFVLGWKRRGVISLCLPSRDVSFLSSPLTLSILFLIADVSLLGPT